jgi:hypothetical protein
MALDQTMIGKLVTEQMEAITKSVALSRSWSSS